VNRLARIGIFVLLFIMLCSIPAYAEGNYPSPTPQFFVNDFAGVLDQSTEKKIAGLGKQLEDKTGAQVVVVTIDSLNGQDIESYSIDLATRWGIGQKGKDNGVLILVAVKERKLRIEVGYGLEGALPDVKTAQIRTDDMNPSLRYDDYDSGIFSGYAAIVNEVAQEYGVDMGDLGSQRNPAKTYPSSSRSRNVTFFPIMFVLLLVADGIFFRFRITGTLIRILFWASFFGGGGRGGRGGFGGGGFGGGGFGGSSGGGGSFGGGGSSGGY
jgi:uncharacterized protein